MSLKDILLDIHAPEEDLLDFERQYGIRSETFYSVYRTWLTRQAEYRDAEQQC